jgi:hypothetical protein
MTYPDFSVPKGLGNAGSLRSRGEGTGRRTSQLIPASLAWVWVGMGENSIASPVPESLWDEEEVARERKGGAWAKCRSRGPPLILTVRREGFFPSPFN